MSFKALELFLKEKKGYRRRYVRAGQKQFLVLFLKAHFAEQGGKSLVRAKKIK